jgi:hypothetical protein
MGIDKISIAYTECRQYRLETISSTHTDTETGPKHGLQDTGVSKKRRYLRYPARGVE